MTNPACATRTGKVAMIKAHWRPPLRAAHVTRVHTERVAMSALPYKMRGSLFACVAHKEPLFAPDPRTATEVASKHEDRGGLALRLGGCLRCAPLTHVFPMGLETPRLRYGDNGPALEFKPGGT